MEWGGDLGFGLGGNFGAAIVVFVEVGPWDSIVGVPRLLELRLAPAIGHRDAFGRESWRIPGPCRGR